MSSKDLFSNKSGKVSFNTEKDTDKEAIDIGDNIPVCPVDLMIGMRSLEAYVHIYNLKYSKLYKVIMKGLVVYLKMNSIKKLQWQHNLL